MFRKKIRASRQTEPAKSAPRVPAQPPARLPAPPAVSPNALNGVTLAFIGDGVYELLVRSHVLRVCGGRVNELHRQTVAFSNAAFQGAAARALEPLLTGEEAAVFRRGRNAHVGHTPKNKSAAQYHAATGLEALFGWLYLTNQTARLNALFAKITALNGEFQNGKEQE